MLVEDVVFYSGWTLLSIAAVAMNLVLLRVIYLNRAKQHLAVFSIFLVEGSLSHVCLAVLSWILLPRAEGAYPIASYRIVGVGQFLGRTTCSILYILFNHFSCLQPATILISFILRLICIRRSISLSFAFVMAVIAYFPAVIYLVLMLTCHTEGDKTEEGVVVYLKSNIWEYSAACIILIGILIVSFLLCLVLRALILRAVGKYTSTNMSEKTRKIHKALVKTLTIQSITTAVPLIAITFFLLRSQVQQSLFFSSIRFIIFAFIALADSAVPLYYVRPYSKSIFRKKQENNENSVSIFSNKHSAKIRHSIF